MQHIFLQDASFCQAVPDLARKSSAEIRDNIDKQFFRNEAVHCPNYPTGIHALQEQMWQQKGQFGV